MTGDSPPVTSPDVNWGAFLDQVARDYSTEPALGLWHGLQKEGIQNSHGARDRQSKTPWGCMFRLLKFQKGLLLTITDEGTFGLTGSSSQGAESRPDTLPSTERLARFESMFDSGGGEGPGLFGRGKLIFNACSEQRLIYYDSLTREGKYRFGKRHFIGRKCEQYTTVLEGEEARARLRMDTGGALEPLTTPGTRITIVDPIEEVLDSIKSGNLLTAIGDTWWEIIQKEEAKISVTGLNGQVNLACVPENFGGLPKVPRNKWRVSYIQNTSIEVGDARYKIKRLHILVPPQSHKLREEQLGIFLHRRGMQIGRLQTPGIPDEVRDRLFGYLQLDEPFEEVLAASENTTHYGFSHTKRPEFKAMRKWVQDNLSSFLDSIGYGPKTDPNSRARESAEEAQAALDTILKDLGVPSLGTGQDSRREISVSIEDLAFPRGANRVDTGDKLEGFSFRVHNRTSNPMDVAVEVSTHTDEAGRIETILPKSKILLGANQSKPTGALRIDFSQGVYPSKTRIGCSATVSRVDGTQLARRTFYVYLDAQPPQTEAALAEIELLEVEFPRQDSHRVDFGQSLLGLTYLIHNRTPLKMAVQVKVRTIWAAEGVELDEVLDRDEVIGPFGSAECQIEEIKVSKDRYAEVGRGKIKLRCSATATEATPAWEKGRRLAELTTMFYLNMDPSYGLFEDCPLMPMGPQGPRSKPEPTAGNKSWILGINPQHPAYIKADVDNDLRTEYFFEESARQAAYVLLRRDQAAVILKILKLDPKTRVDDMDPDDLLQTLVYPFTDRILSSYYG
jgi:hypothetical protein